MKPITKAQWIAALRSGKYSQGQNVLCDGTNHCCLGVLAEEAGVPKVTADCWPDGEPEYRFLFTTPSADVLMESATIPVEVHNTILQDLDLGQDVAEGGLFGNVSLQTRLITMNDDGLSFNIIADYLETLETPIGKNMIKNVAIALAAATLLATPAAAQTFTLGAATDNMSKGLSKTRGESALIGEVEWRSGRAYSRTGFQTIQNSGGSDLELSATTGYRPSVAGFDLDLNAVYKYQVDSAPTYDNDAWEFTADVKRSVGRASGQVRLQYSPDGTGSTEAWTWVEAQAGWTITDRLKGTAAIGRREQDGGEDYSAWNAGVSYSLTSQIRTDLRYYDSDTAEPGSVVAAVRFTF